MIRHVLMATGACLVLGAAAAAPVRTPPLAPGIAFTIRTTAEPGGQVSTTKVRWLDGVARFEVQDEKGRDGSGYMLVDAKARSAARCWRLRNRDASGPASRFAKPFRRAASSGQRVRMRSRCRVRNSASAPKLSSY